VLAVELMSISRAEAIQAVRRRAGEISSEVIHVFGPKANSGWRSMDEIEQSVMRSVATFWAPNGPHRHELTIVLEDNECLFVDVQQFVRHPLNTRYAEMTGPNSYVGKHRAARSPYMKSAGEG
jgi:hypothetical protein